MRSILDLMVDGSIVKEAVLINLKTMRIRVQGRNPSAPLCRLAMGVIQLSPSLDYCVLGDGRRKYLVVTLKDKHYVALSLSGGVNGEEYAQRFKEDLKRLGML